MSEPTQQPSPNTFTRGARKIISPLGFRKGYNFVLFFIFAGAFVGFILARFQYLSLHGVLCNPDITGSNTAGPGECYYYLRNPYKVGILLHLGCVLPAGFLVVFQFLPVIRHKLILFHRLNGYLVLLLFLISTVGAFMIARHAFGGGLDVQSAVGVLGIMCVVSMALAYINIKRLQIEQHRAWMLRGWFYAGCIITARIIMAISASVITAQESYFSARPCAQVAFTLKSDEETLKYYPECETYFNGTDSSKQVVVNAKMNGISSEIGAALGVSFGMAIWVAMFLHAVGVEIYLHLTPRESERMRQVSYQRQLEAGMKNPGSAGLVVQRVGDAEPWVPKSEAGKQGGDNESHP